MKLSIVIPCYNEAGNIPHLLEAYAKAIIRDDVEVVIVNNGSTDNTARVLSTLSITHQRFLRVITLEINKGYGYGVIAGLEAARGEFVGWTHGDMQTPAKDVIKALDLIEKNNSATNLYIKGTRTGRPLVDKFFTTGMSIFETIYLHTRLYDINAQPNIFHRSFFESWKNPPHDFSLDLYTLYTAKQQRLTLIRFQVPFLPRAHGTSKWNTGLVSKWKFIKRTILFSTKLKQQLK
jgi:glycosyltransferase involved in cell wall biosynthesis